MSNSPFIFLISNCNLLILEKHIQEVYRDLKNRKKQKKVKKAKRLAIQVQSKINSPLF